METKQYPDTLIAEYGFIKRAITEYYPTGIVSIVSDTLDFWSVISVIATALKEDILNRKPNALGLAKVVFRPDSGNPVDIVCGDANAPVGSPQHKGAIECLWDIFGGTVTEQGFKVLNERVGLIYGDSITQKIAYDTLTRLKEKGFASTNIVFGVGSFTLNYLTRDCLSIAIKATWAQVNGVGYNIFKDPVTDNGTKKSARGLLRVDRVGNDFVLKDQCTAEEEKGGELKVVFENGNLIKDYTLQEVRNNLAQYV